MQKQSNKAIQKNYFHQFCSLYHRIVRFCWGRDSRRSRFPPPFRLPLHPRDAHHHFFVLDRDPAREHFHRVFEVRVQEYVPRAVNEGGRNGMEDVEAAVEGRRGGRRSGGFGVAEEHEDVPDTELGGERDGVVEEGQIPTGAVGGWGDVIFVLL